MPAWTLDAAMNVVIAGAYLAITWTILRGLVATGQLHANPLAGATALIFFTCAVHHGGEAAHLLAPAFTADAGGRAARVGVSWQMGVWDVFGAGVAILYLSLRSSYGLLLRAPSMFHDLDRERVQAAVAEERAALAEAQATARLGSWRVELPAGEVVTSAEYQRLFGLADADVSGSTHLRVHAEDRRRFLDARRRLFATGEPMDETFRVQMPDGSERVLRALGRAELGPENRPVRALGTVQDVTDLVDAETARERAEARFTGAFERTGVPMALVGIEGDDAGRLLEVNDAYARMLGVPRTELQGAELSRWIHPEDRARTFVDPLNRIGSGLAEQIEVERRYLGPGHRIIPTLITESHITDASGRPVMIEQALDISERKRFELELRHMADHDALTGLFNRRRFDAELHRALLFAHRYGGGALLMLDLDGFKRVNDTLGHPAGDALVTRIAATLRRVLRETDVLARTGGDEFAVILPAVTEAEARGVAEKLLEVVRVNGSAGDGARQIRVTTSVGITLFGDGDVRTRDDLLMEADIAMYDAKAAGKDRMTVYRRDPTRRTVLPERIDLSAGLSEAVDQDGFVLWAQEIVALGRTGRPHYELLLRLPDPGGDLIPPAAFLADAERYGVIERIDAWVLAQAFSLLEQHARAGHDLCLTVNVSACTLSAGWLAGHLTELLERHDVPPHGLVLEITETAAITNMDTVRDFAREVRGHGVGLALDDFGAGFATFYYLKHLTFDYVKIDGEFIRELTENRADQLVVRSLVEICRGLGVQTVAESVPDEATVELLREIGVDFAQGFHTGRPGPVEQVLPGFVEAG